MTTRCCPTCGHDLPGGLVPVEALVDAALSSQQRAIVEVLVGAYPRTVSMEKLVDALWGDDPNGGPDNPRRVVHAQVCHIRRILAASGWTIPNLLGGWGNRNGRYRLERLP